MLSVAQAIHHSEAQGSNASEHLGQSWPVDEHNMLKRRKLESDSDNDSTNSEIESIDGLPKCFNFNSAEVTLTAIPRSSSQPKEHKPDHFQGQIKISPINKMVGPVVVETEFDETDHKILRNIPSPIMSFLENSPDVVLTKLTTNSNIKVKNVNEINNNETSISDTNEMQRGISNPLKGFSEVTIEPRIQKSKLESDSCQPHESPEKERIRPKITRATEFLRKQQNSFNEVKEEACKEINDYDQFTYSRPSHLVFDEPVDPIEDVAVVIPAVVDYEPFNVGILASECYNKNSKPHFAAGFPNPPGENRCWTNATLQALFALEIGRFHSLELPETSKLMSTFIHVQRAWRNGNTENNQFNRIFNNFKKELSVLDSLYSSKAQQDVSEFIMNLLNFIKTEFDSLIEKQSHKNEIENVPNNDQDQHVAPKPLNNGQDPSGRLPLVDISSKQIPNIQSFKYSKNSLEETSLKNNSLSKIHDDQNLIKSNPIDDNFLLNMMEIYKCDNCSKTRSLKIENLMLFIDLPEKHDENAIDLVDLINKTYTEENRSIVCESCKHNGQTMQVKFKKLPRVLTVQVKRYEMTLTGHIIKKNTLVQIPEFLKLDSLKMNNPDFDHSPVYETVGVISHIGDSIDSGHYVSFVKHEDQWFYYDDITVKLVSVDDVINCVQNNVYVLFFQDTDFSVKFGDKYQEECTMR